MKNLKQLLSKIEAVEERVRGIAAEKANHLDRETACYVLSYCCLTASYREALHATAARGKSVGEAEIAAEKRFKDLRARFAACIAMTAAHDVWQEFHAPYRGFEPSILRVFKALELPEVENGN